MPGRPPPALGGLVPGGAGPGEGARPGTSGPSSWKRPLAEPRLSPGQRLCPAKL